MEAAKTQMNDDYVPDLGSDGPSPFGSMQIEYQIQEVAILHQLVQEDHQTDRNDADRVSGVLVSNGNDCIAKDHFSSRRGQSIYANLHEAIY